MRGGVESFVRFLAFAGVAILAGAAAAADMKPLTKAPPPYAYGGTFNWSGLYAGGFVGGAHALWTVDFFRKERAASLPCRCQLPVLRAARAREHAARGRIGGPAPHLFVKHERCLT